MKSPSRNIPMKTVIVAAAVVERFAPSDRHASEKSSRARPLKSRSSGGQAAASAH
jgi:hypothetical protein